MSDLVGKTVGKYRIVARLGRGGLAEVYKAYQPGLDRYVSIKVLHSHLRADKDFSQRFEREARAIGKLHHPNIIQALDFDQEGDLYFMVMEYIDGPTLKHEIKARQAANQPFSLEEIARIFMALCSAIEYAHAQQMVHRDLKPSNVMINQEGQVVLTDFGIARVMGATQYTTTGALSGTPAYMSPEQGQGEQGDERSDIYSLGVILYEMTTGMVPYDAETPFALIMRHISEPLPLPTKVNPNIPESVERVILKAMSKDPDDRYQTAGKLAEDLYKAIRLTANDTLSSTPLKTVAQPPKVVQIDHPTGPLIAGTQTATTVAVPYPGALSRGLPILPLVIGGAIVAILLVAGIAGAIIMNRPISTPTPDVAALIGSTKTAESQIQATIYAIATFTAESVVASTQTARAANDLAITATAQFEQQANLIQGSLATAAAATVEAATAQAAASMATAEAIAKITLTPSTAIALTPEPVTGTPTPMLTSTPEPLLEIAENIEISDLDALGEINIEYPIRMSPGSSDHIVVSVYIPDRLVSLVPLAIERIEIPPDAPPIIGELRSYQANILIQNIMRIELSSPTFQVEALYPSTQQVNLNKVTAPTFWAWTIVAPETIGTHVLTIRVYLGNADTPSWVASLEIGVSEIVPETQPIPSVVIPTVPTETVPAASVENFLATTPSTRPISTTVLTPSSTSVLISTNTPIVVSVQTASAPSTSVPNSIPVPTPIPFVDRPVGVAVVEATGTIIAALIIALIIFVALKGSIPITGIEAIDKLSLKTLYSNLARLEKKAAEYGSLDVPVKIENEIQLTKEKIAEIESKLKESEAN